MPDPITPISDLTPFVRHLVPYRPEDTKGAGYE